MYHYASSGFETFIYIVFGILYLLYKYSSSKNAKNKKQEEETLPPIVDVPEFLRNIRNEAKHEKVQEVVTPRVVKTQHHPHKIKSRIVKSENLELIDIGEEDDESATTILGVPARESIIISEILKRPEY